MAGRVPGGTGPAAVTEKLTVGPGNIYFDRPGEQPREFRPDGWPLCPECGEDEVYSHALLGVEAWEAKKLPTLDEIAGERFQCYRCHWFVDSLEARAPRMETTRGGLSE